MIIEKTLSGLRGRKLQGQLFTFALDTEADTLHASARAASDGLASNVGGVFKFEVSHPERRSDDD